MRDCLVSKSHHYVTPQQVNMVSVQSFLVLVCLLSFSFANPVEPPPPPGPPKPIISKTFSALLIVNSTINGSSAFNGLEFYSIDAVNNRTVFNLTDFNQDAFHMTQLFLAQSGKGYKVNWNHDVSDGDCTQVPATVGDPLWWVDDVEYVQYDEFLNWVTWGYTSKDKQTNAVIIISPDDPTRPLIMIFRNQTFSYTSIFVSFDSSTPPDRYFNEPLPCTKPSPQAKPSHPTNIASLGSVMQKPDKYENHVGSNHDNMVDLLTLSKEATNMLAMNIGRRKN